jgi:fatty-acyl-CoA synthase
VTKLRSVLFSVRVLLVLTLTLPPLWLFVVVTPRRATHRLVQRWARGIVALSGCRLRVTGLHCLPVGTGVVMVANHSSFLDSVVLLAAIPGEYWFVANHLAATRPLLGTIIRKSGYLVVDRRSVRSRSACARAMSTALEAGTSLLLFPEGTRNSNHLLPFKIGAFRAAAKTAHPVVPIAIAGTRQMLPRDFRLLEQAPLSVQVLAPITAETAGVRYAAHLRDRAHAAVAEALVES